MSIIVHLYIGRKPLLLCSGGVELAPARSQRWRLRAGCAPCACPDVLRRFRCDWKHRSIIWNMFKAWLLEAHRPKTDLAGCACQAGVGQSLAAPLVEQGGKLYQQASYQDGQAHVYASNIPTLGGIVAGTYPTPGGPNTAGGSGATYLSLNISGNDAANFMTGQFVTPQFVTDQAMAAQYSSY